MGGLLESVFGRTEEHDFYECTYCLATFEEWPAGCPDCGQLVVRIVERQGDGR